MTAAEQRLDRGEAAARVVDGQIGQTVATQAALMREIESVERRSGERHQTVMTTLRDQLQQLFRQNTGRPSGFSLPRYEPQANVQEIRPSHAILRLPDDEAP